MQYNPSPKIPDSKSCKHNLKFSRNSFAINNIVQGYKNSIRDYIAIF